VLPVFDVARGGIRERKSLLAEEIEKLAVAGPEQFRRSPGTDLSALSLLKDEVFQHNAAAAHRHA
jgi:hypothetical protein